MVGTWGLLTNNLNMIFKQHLEFYDLLPLLNTLLYKYLHNVIVSIIQITYTSHK